LRDDNIAPALDRAPPQASNPFAGPGDYPSTVTLFEQRAVWARTRNVPHGIWTTRSGQLENMDRSRPLRADDSMAFAIRPGGSIRSTSWCHDQPAGADLGQRVSYRRRWVGRRARCHARAAARRQIGRGSSRLPPLVVDNVVFYQPSVGRTVRTIGYDFTIDGLKSNDVSIFSPHFFERMGIVSWCYAQEPRSVIWAAREDGALLHLGAGAERLGLDPVRNRRESAVGLRHSRGRGGPRLPGGRADMEGVARRFVERMASHAWSDVRETCFLDCAVSGTFDTPRTSFSGLWHLEGRSDVAGLVDGVAVMGLTVSQGTLVLPPHMDGATQATFGIPYTVDIETLPVRLTTQGAPRWGVGNRSRRRS
jgi:hypothetical protein